MSRLLVILLILFCAPFLSGAEELSNALEDWFAVEKALNQWTNASPDTTMAAGTELLLTLEKFSNTLDKFTGSLLFSQYKRIGLLPKNSGMEISQMTFRLIASVNEGNSSAAKLEAELIGGELASYIQLDTEVSSRGFSRLAWLFSVFIILTIILFGVIWHLYRALIRSQIQEKNSAEFSRVSILVQEKERAYLSAELHDTVLQDMGRLLQISEENNPSFHKLTLEIMTRIREICRELMPPDFSRLALTDSLKQLCMDFEKHSGTECRTAIAEDFSRAIESGCLSPQMQLQLYRIVQESLANIEKHNKASEVILTVRNNDNKTLLVCVTDDGVISTEALNTGSLASGLGIRGMYQRAAILGASLSFIPGAGQGLTVRLEVPLN